jgi:hypothetical protein
VIYENDWLTNNVLDLKKRKKNIPKEIICEYVPGDFEKSSVIDASFKIANTLKNKYEHIYVAYSGGQDTEFIVNTLHSVGAKFTPIAVEANHTTDEIKFAYANCKRLGLDLVILDFMGNSKDEELAQLYQYHVLGKYDYVQAFYSHFYYILIHDYIKKIHPDAILINGHNAIPTSDFQDSWSLMIDLWEEVSTSMLSFMMYNQHIVYETCDYMQMNRGYEWWKSEFETNSRPEQSNMYGLEPRLKIRSRRTNITYEDKLLKEEESNKRHISGKSPPRFKLRGSNEIPLRLHRMWRNLNIH